MLTTSKYQNKPNDEESKEEEMKVDEAVDTKEKTDTEEKPTPVNAKVLLCQCLLVPIKVSNHPSHLCAQCVYTTHQNRDIKKYEVSMRVPSPSRRLR